jgi:mono/diheme cytochrome c family protein
MPNMGISTGMSDEDVAAVVTYVRSSWGNNAAAATPEEVAAIRKKQASRTAPMAEADLKALPE